MLDVDRRFSQTRQPSLAQWVHSRLGQSGVRLRVRLRGNNLHILCESQEPLDAQRMVKRLVTALESGDSALPVDPGCPIYQVILYGKVLGQSRPQWVESIRLEDIKPIATTATPEPPSSRTDLLISNESLARSGSPEAIARYLSETLSPLGVSVKVVLQNPPNASKDAPRRLWVICNSNYSPDPSLLAEPIAQKLRNLQLHGFSDGLICTGVRGESAPEWILRVDLTPTVEMLLEWAAWGDIQAIARLLNQDLAEQHLQVRAVLKDVTLHLFCSATGTQRGAIPDRQTAIRTIHSLLEDIAPQGIQAATVYGVKGSDPTLTTVEQTPSWIDWLDLPASKVPELADSTFHLAGQGDTRALTFLIVRLLNPDLDERLATGGIRVAIRRKQDLLHVMSESPVCPPQATVAQPVAQFIRQLGLPEIAGVRVYGRRSGQASPLWSYGVDFIHRKRLVPEATPEFAATDAYMGELIAPTGELAWQPSYSNRFRDALTNIRGGQLVEGLRQGLCYTQLWVPAVESHSVPLPRSHETLTSDSLRDSKAERIPSSGLKTALVWSALGLLLMVQGDWLLGHALPNAPTDVSQNAPNTSPKALTLPKVSLRKGQSNDGFNNSGFTRQGETSVIVSKEESQANARQNAFLAASQSLNPSFNVPLLDEKLALYQQRIQQKGVPDVLIVGSSRALRGIDPVALQDALTVRGYPDVEIYNFGINGATVQVVDFLLRRVLTPEQLPKLIIWADGARAFNSGRVDITYNAIAASEGYQHLNTKQESATNITTDRSLNVQHPMPNPQSFNTWLNDRLASLSQTYSHRQQIISLLQISLQSLLPIPPVVEPQITPKSELSGDDSVVDSDGFMSLSIRFNPTTYYQKYAKVKGNYDSDYQSFQLKGRQDDALKNLLKFTQSQQINLVFVNLPLTKEYLDPARTNYEQNFQTYLQSVATEDFIIRDLGKLWMSRNNYFSDPSHLNRYGAYEVSNQLAKDPLIPWSLATGNE